MKMTNFIPWKRKRKQNTRTGSLPEKWWDPFQADDLFPSLSLFHSGPWTPGIDISEGRKHVTIRAEIPGMDKKDIDVSIENGLLRIQGEKRHEQDESDENFLRRETAWGWFSRTIELPAAVDEQNVDARYKKGVLTIKLRKTRDDRQSRIQIKSG